MRLLALAATLGACSEFRIGRYVAHDGAAHDYDGSCGTVLGAPCNPYVQTGCPSGAACQVVDTADGGTTAACMTPGAGGFGARCDSTAGCNAGLTCTAGQCRPLCCPDDPEACLGPDIPNGARCDLDFGFAAALRVCSLHCSWLRQDCSTGGTCVPLDVTGNITDCIAPGAGTNGAACAVATDCSRGFVCVIEAASRVCRRICDPTSSTESCGLAQFCQTVAGAPDSFGVCR